MRGKLIASKSFETASYLYDAFSLPPLSVGKVGLSSRKSRMLHKLSNSGYGNIGKKIVGTAISKLLFQSLDIYNFPTFPSTIR
jgi:hypothetical protein